MLPVGYRPRYPYYQVQEGPYERVGALTAHAWVAVGVHAALPLCARTPHAPARARLNEADAQTRVQWLRRLRQPFDYLRQRTQSIQLRMYPMPRPWPHALEPSRMRLGQLARHVQH